MLKYMLIIMLYFLAQPAGAAAKECDVKECDTKGCDAKECNDKNEPGRRLSGYQPSYFSVADDGVDTHLEFSVSLKYPLDDDVAWLGRFIKGPNKVYFAYTGQYDFFVFSDNVPGRSSAPVVSRLQNPGLFLKHIVTSQDIQELSGLESISLGWFHESNGQQIDGSDTSTFNNTLNASDYVSRGWDYLGIDFKQHYSNVFKSGDTVDFYTRLRVFCACQGFGSISGREDDVTVFTGEDTEDIRYYDGLRLIFDHAITPTFSYGIQFRTGIAEGKSFDNRSYRAEINFRIPWDPIEDIPFNLFYFNGYGVNISTYHIHDDYIGFGIKMW